MQPMTAQQPCLPNGPSRGRSHAAKMKCFVALIATCVALDANVGSVAEEPTSGPVFNLDAYLEEPIAQGQTPGLWAAIIDGTGVRAIGAAGVRRQGASRAVTADDLLHIGSNTKAMTATMLAMLVEDGTFANGWETTILEVFPELREDIHEKYHPVTLSQLVRMEGGMVHMPNDQWAYARTPNIVKRRYKIIQESLGSAPRELVGWYAYSNLSYVVAGAMAERVTGESWETLMEERLFAPLGITTAGFGPPGSHRGMDQPWGHQRSDRGGWKSNKFDNDPMLGPAGTIHISIGDWARFVALWFREREPEILGRAALDELTNPGSSAGDYAAGWFAWYRGWARGRALFHDGSNLSWRSSLWIAPERGLAYLSVANATEDIYGGDDTFWMLDSIIGRLIQDTPAILAEGYD